MATAAEVIITMTTDSLYKLMAWLSPSYPVGAFAYSHGIEWAVEIGIISNMAGLTDWIEDLVRYGSGWSDAVAFCHAYDRASDGPALRELNEFLVAMAPSSERHLETTAQGNAFLKTTCDAWPWQGCESLPVMLGGDAAYPVAVAVAARGHGIDKSQALTAFLHGIAANWVSAAVRLIPLGQTDGQRALAKLEPVLAEVAAKAPASPLSDIGGIAVLSDIAAMRHETQYTRLFRS